MEETLPVRDGVVHYGQFVWYRSLPGPKKVIAAPPHHWENIAMFPEAYSIQEPRGYFTYLD